MVRISKLTDYAVVIMAYMAKSPNKLFQAREIAADTSIAYPTVSKLLRKLTNNQLLRSNRGVHGGYQLASPAHKISVANIINALEGPIAITECSLGDSFCDNASHCSLRNPWLQINRVIGHALDSIRLSDLIQPSHNLSSILMTKLANANNTSSTTSIPIHFRGGNHGNHDQISS